MKKTVLLSLALCSGIIFAQETPQFKRCYSPEYIEYQEQKTPGFKQDVNEQFELAKNSYSTKSNETYIIPVVVHIVYKTASQNIADSVVHNQIATLNEDFQRKNADTVNMRSDFDIVAGNPNIEFRLASTDPNGNPTSGITRSSTSTESFMDFMGFMNGDMSTMEAVKKSNEGGIDPWDQSRYLNIWVCNMAIDFMGNSTPVVLGYATPPSGLSNWPPGSTGGLKDGVVVQFEAFGSNNPNPINLGGGPLEVLGRTATHEVGHYLGLRHIWGDGGCTEEDGIADTPNAIDKSEGCPTSANTCLDNIQGLDLPDMVENYMDYSDEDCQNSFTKGQADLMRGVLENQRENLITNNPALDNTAAVQKESFTAALYPNPTDNVLNIRITNGVLENVEVYNTYGQMIQSKESIDSVVQLDVSQLEKGVYLVKIKDNLGSVVVQRFVKN